VIRDAGVRAAPLAAADGTPIKAEGIAVDPSGHAWITVEPDEPAQLLEVELTGP
jgi:hypothetical protein